jgi:hypothetical protein
MKQWICTDASKLSFNITWAVPCKNGPYLNDKVLKFHNEQYDTSFAGTRKIDIVITNHRDNLPNSLIDRTILQINKHFWPGCTNWG